MWIPYSTLFQRTNPSPSSLPASFKKTISKPGGGYCKSLAPACAKPLRRRQGGTFGSQLHAFLGKTGTSRKVRASVTLDFLKIRNCKGLEVPSPGFDIATSGFNQYLFFNFALCLNAVSLWERFSPFDFHNVVEGVADNSLHGIHRATTIVGSHDHVIHP